VNKKRGDTSTQGGEEATGVLLSRAAILRPYIHGSLAESGAPRNSSDATTEPLAKMTGRTDGRETREDCGLMRGFGKKRLHLGECPPNISG